MLLYKFIHQWNDIIVSYNGSSIPLYVFTFRFPILIQYHLGCITVAVITVIIGQVIDRKHKCFLIRRQHNLAFLKVHVAILIRSLFHHIMEINKHITLVVHNLGNLVKFLDGCHPLVITHRLRIRLLVCKAKLRVYHQ